MDVGNKTDLGQRSVVENKVDAVDLECDFEDSPLMFVIAHISFTQSPEIFDRIAEVKRTLGEDGLLYAEKKQQTTYTSQGSGPPSVRQKTFWTFTSMSRDRVVAVSTNSLVIYDAAYTRFPIFSTRIAKYVDAVARLAGNGCFSTTTALRFVSGFRVQNVPTESVHSAIRGLPADVFDTKHFHHEYRYWCDVNKGGRLSVVVKSVHGDELLPKDIEPYKLSINPKFTMTHSEHAIQLEIFETFQHSKENLTPLTAQNVVGVLASIRKNAKTAFLLVTTNEAHRQWKIINR